MVAEGLKRLGIGMFGRTRSEVKQKQSGQQEAAPLSIQQKRRETETIVSDISDLEGVNRDDLSQNGLLNFEPYCDLGRRLDGSYVILMDESISLHAEIGLKNALGRKKIVADRIFVTAEVLQVFKSRSADSASIQQEAYDASSIERLGAEIVQGAIKRGASDIHIEVRVTHADVFYRIFGRRIRGMTISVESAFYLAVLWFDAQADQSAKLEVKWSPHKAIDAAINLSDKSLIYGGKNREIQLRFASSPMYPTSPDQCFQMVLRLLRMDPTSAPPMERIGYTPGQEALVHDFLIGASGLVLLVGPTNSGKSTSLQAMARRIMSVRGEGIKIESIEDPVEYLIPGAVQMPVGNQASFAQLLKGTLRHDPDVLIVGEIRDAESAESIKNIVLAGRKVLATLHTYSAMAAWARLSNIGVPEDVLYMPGFISGIVYQRLVPKLCHHCSFTYEEAYRRGIVDPNLHERVIQHFPLDTSNVRVRNPEGCSHCKDRYPGYSGQTIVAEIIRPDEVMLDYLRRGDVAQAKNYWMETSSGELEFGANAMGHAMKLVAEGLVDPVDVETQVGILSRYNRPGAGSDLSSQSSTFSRVRPVPNDYFTASESGSSNEMESLYEASRY